MPNIFSDYDIPSTGERFDELLRGKNVRIERIVSSAAPDQKEYRQDDDEWVVLLKGGATIEMNGAQVELRAGDYLFIPRDTPHKVVRTEKGSLWLAVHVE